MHDSPSLCDQFTSSALAAGGTLRVANSKAQQPTMAPREVLCDPLALTFMMAPFPSWLAGKLTPPNPDGYPTEVGVRAAMTNIRDSAESDLLEHTVLSDS